MITTIREVHESLKQIMLPWRRHSAAVMLTMFAFYFLSVTGATCITQVPNYVLMAIYGAFLAEERNLVTGFAR